MGDIVILTETYAPAVRQWLDHELAIMNQEGLVVELEQWEVNQHTLLFCRCQTSDQSAEEVFVYYIASALAGSILTSIEADWVKKRLRRLGGFLLHEERNAMAARILAILAQSYADDDGLPRAKVLLDLMDYLSANRAVHLEGFIRFRLKAYQKQIDQVIAGCLQEWQAQQEHLEFIELLRYFMASQDSRLDSVEVIVNRNGLFRLLDESHHEIDNNYLEGFVADLVQGAVDNGELLISVLITLAPRELHCHLEEHLPVIDTLHGVFAEHMSICYGCEVCGRQGRRKGTLPARPNGY